MARDTQKYTRWTNDSDIDDDDDEEAAHVDAPLDQGEGYEQMQEGRRVLEMMTPKNPEEGIRGLSRLAFARLVCAMILLTALCLTFGALVGYLIGSSSYRSNSLPASQSCPTPSPTVKSTTPARPTEEDFGLEDNFYGLEDTFSTPGNIHEHLSPELIRHYIRHISNIEPDELDDYLSSAFKSLGFTVEDTVFPIITSAADRENPNTVEVLMENGSAEIVNNITESLNGSLPFSGFSPNGTANGPLVFANYGSEEDYKNLEAANVTANGSILLIKLQRVHPSIQVRRAEGKGALAVILYPDIADFGANSSNAPYPDGRALPSDAVISQNLRVIPGDPSTPNYGSQRGVFRIREEKYAGVPSIPVQPVSFDTATLLRNLLEGKGSISDWRPENKTVTVRVTVNNLILEDTSHVLVAYLPAEDHSKVVHLGSHYDVRDYRLTSSGIGLASLLALGDALHQACPNGTRRLVAFTAFEGKDGDFSGGNEYSQLFTWWLESTAMAYLDLDVVLEGSGFLEGAVSPILRGISERTFQNVAWVEGEGLNVIQGLMKALPDHYAEENKEHLMLQNTFEFSNPFECDESTNFLNVHGIPVIQFTSIGHKKSENAFFFLRDSQYDTMEALINLEDKELHWTHMVVSILGEAAIILSTVTLPPARFTLVGWDIKNAWTKFLKDEKEAINASPPSIQELTSRITSAIDSFLLTCEAYQDWYDDSPETYDKSSQYQIYSNVEVRLQTLMRFNRRFLRPRNIPRHSDFGSLVTYGPSLEDPCEGMHFPVVRKTLREATEGVGPWDIVHEELSLLLSSLAEIRTNS